MQSPFLPNHPPLQTKARRTTRQEDHSKAMAFSSKIKCRIAELEIIIAKSRQSIKASNFKPHKPY